MSNGVYDTIKKLNECVESSQKEPVCVFKHSNTCPISMYAKQQVDSFLQMDGQTKIYLVVVQDQRPLSNEIASKMNVKHESPQLLVLKDGEVKSILNHQDITISNIQNELQRVQSD